MTIRDIYPFWPETHSEMVERLLYIGPESWDIQRLSSSSVSIRQIVVRLARHERMWVEQVILGRTPAQISGVSKLSPEDLVSELKSARAVTQHFLSSRTVESLREVREAPADPKTNEPERNVPINWIIWRILETELMGWGQIQLLLDD